MLPNRFSRLLVASVCLFLSGCAGFQRNSASPEERVAERALAQAQALQAGDYQTALEYTTPAYRASPRAASYQAQYNGTTWWSDVTVGRVTCEQIADPLRCEVRLIVTVFRPPMTSSAWPIPLDKTWIRVEGDWYVFER